MNNSFCAECGAPTVATDRFCRRCGAPKDTETFAPPPSSGPPPGGAGPGLHPSFQAVEDAYRHLRAQYDTGAISAEQLTHAVESQSIEHAGAYWMMGVDSGAWYRSTGDAWQLADPPRAASGFSPPHPAGYAPAASAGYASPPAGYAPAPMAGGHAIPAAQPNRKRAILIGAAVLLAGGVFFGRNWLRGIPGAAVEYSQSP